MSDGAKKLNATTSTSTILGSPSAAVQLWPTVVAAPADWEAGSAAHRTGRMPVFRFHPGSRSTIGGHRRSGW